MRARQGGLSQAGQSRLNKSIKAFVYCILGAQVNRRSTIMGDGGRANERRASFSYWLKTPLSNQTWPRACSDTNWLWTKQGAFEFHVETWGLAAAYENSDKHRKSGRLQQQNHAANAKHKARDKQRKHRQKSGAASHGRRSVKN